MKLFLFMRIMKRLGFVVLLSSFLSYSHAQTDSVATSTSCSGLILPAALISYGVLTKVINPLTSFDKSIAYEADKQMKSPVIMDDYIQYASYVAVYGLDLAGIKAKHNVVDRTIVLATSCLISGAVVQTTKRVTKIQRPDGSNEHSFPSGHTATAFLGAHLLFREYKDVSPWIGVAGYTVATATGTMRILNKKHWFSDVVAGAGVGILSVELGYLLLPMWHNLLGMKDDGRSLVIVPTVSKANLGVGLVYTFGN